MVSYLTYNYALELTSLREGAQRGVRCREMVCAMIADRHQDKVVVHSIMGLVALLGPALGSDFVEPEVQWAMINGCILVVVLSVIGLLFYSRFECPKYGFPLWRICLSAILSWLMFVGCYEIAKQVYEPKLVLMFIALPALLVVGFTLWAFSRRNEPKRDDGVNHRIVSSSGEPPRVSRRRHWCSVCEFRVRQE